MNQKQGMYQVLPDKLKQSNSLGQHYRPKRYSNFKKSSMAIQTKSLDQELQA